jgi:hypothetical protein
MSPSPETNRQTATEWRQLGFFYEVLKADKTWRFVGSQRGLRNFPRLLREYAANPRNSRISEHRHCGPYGDLKIVTWNEALIKGDGIWGSLTQLANLADLIEKRVPAISLGESATVGRDYSPQSEFTLRFEVMEDEFDPASADVLLL